MKILEMHLLYGHHRFGILIGRSQLMLTYVIRLFIVWAFHQTDLIKWALCYYIIYCLVF